MPSAWRKSSPARSLRPPMHRCRSCRTRPARPASVQPARRPLRPDARGTEDTMRWLRERHRRPAGARGGRHGRPGPDAAPWSEAAMVRRPTRPGRRHAGPAVRGPGRRRRADLRRRRHTPFEVVQGQNGFLRGTLRGLARARHSEGLDDRTPFHLAAWPDGRLTLDDPATGRRLDLEAFGPATRPCSPACCPASTQRRACLMWPFSDAPSQVDVRHRHREVA